MKIVGFNFDKILAERKKQMKGQIKVNTNLDIDNIKKEEVDIGIPGEILQFTYTYSIKYEPEFAEITFKGAIIVLPEEFDVKEIIKKWKKKEINDDLRMRIFNYIMSKCNLKALQLEEEFALPPHIPMPKLTKQSEQQSKSSPASYAG